MNNKTNTSIGEKQHSKRNKTTIKLNLIIVALISIHFLTFTLLKDYSFFPEYAVISTFIVLAISFFLTLKWYRSLDEFEQRLLDQSGLIALYSGLGISLIWIMLHRFNFIQIELKGWGLIVIMSFISTFYYYGKKFLDR